MWLILRFVASLVLKCLYHYHQCASMKEKFIYLVSPTELHKKSVTAILTNYMLMLCLWFFQRLPTKGFHVTVMPMKIREGSGSPTRIFASIPDAGDDACARYGARSGAVAYLAPVLLVLIAVVFIVTIWVFCVLKWIKLCAFVTNQNKIIYFIQLLSFHFPLLKFPT